jgi:hypothetical protein
VRIRFVALMKAHSRPRSGEQSFVSIHCFHLMNTYDVCVCVCEAMLLIFMVECVILRDLQDISLTKQPMYTRLCNSVSVF